MTHDPDQLDFLLSQYVDGELDGAAQKQVETLLEQNPVLKARVDDFRQTQEMLGRVMMSDDVAGVDWEAQRQGIWAGIDSGGVGADDADERSESAVAGGAVAGRIGFGGTGFLVRLAAAAAVVVLALPVVWLAVQSNRAPVGKMIIVVGDKMAGGVSAVGMSAVANGTNLPGERGLADGRVNPAIEVVSQPGLNQPGAAKAGGGGASLMIQVMGPMTGANSNMAMGFAGQEARKQKMQEPKAVPVPSAAKPLAPPATIQDDPF